VTARDSEVDAVVGLELGADDYITKPYGLLELVVRGATVPLPRKEFELLEVLMSSCGLVVTRDALMNEVWGAGYVGDTKTLDVHIKRLRTKIEDEPGAPKRLVTVRGVGYRYELLGSTGTKEQR
jgi:two-component system response regulator RegX3